MQQWERYRLTVRTRTTSGEPDPSWPAEFRETEKRLGREVWHLVSANTIYAAGSLTEIMWFERPITPDAPPPPPEREPIGFK